MPYTKPDDRHYTDAHVEPLLEALEQKGYSAADACAVVARILGRFVIHHGGPSWAVFRQADSIATGALKALWEVEDDYETVKRTENGDIPELAELRDRVTAMLHKAIMGDMDNGGA